MNLPEVSEKLIEQLNHGSTKAFDKIYHTYYLYLCAIAVYYVHDKRVAGEIVNDVFVSFWQNRHHITYPALPYLRRAIQNASISYLRSSAFNERIMTEQMEEIWAFLENHILSSDNPLQALESSEMNEIILRKVEELLPNAVLFLRRACMKANRTAKLRKSRILMSPPSGCR